MFFLTAFIIHMQNHAKTCFTYIFHYIYICMHVYVLVHIKVLAYVWVEALSDACACVCACVFVGVINGKSCSWQTDCLRRRCWLRCWMASGELWAVCVAPVIFAFLKILCMFLWLSAGVVDAREHTYIYIAYIHIRHVCRSRLCVCVCKCR